jgi:hypothetical protein
MRLTPSAQNHSLVTKNREAASCGRVEDDKMRFRTADYVVDTVGSQPFQAVMTGENWFLLTRWAEPNTYVIVRRLPNAAEVSELQHLRMETEKLMAAKTIGFPPKSRFRLALALGQKRPLSYSSGHADSGAKGHLESSDMRRFFLVLQKMVFQNVGHHLNR